MTDRIHSLTVVLEQDVRDDAVADLVAVLRKLRNVADVSAHIADAAFYAAQVRARQQVTKRILAALDAEAHDAQ